MSSTAWENILIGFVSIAAGLVFFRTRARAYTRWNSAMELFPKRWQHPVDPGVATSNQTAGAALLVALGLLAIGAAVFSLVTGHPLSS
jgi:uncharacterized membrane protein HdeD (DUF308 family)